jgi:REP element-mobilizing transposase RayT
MAAEQRCMKQPAYLLDGNRRDCVLKALQHISTDRGWTLLAAHVRTSHVHAVVGADEKPEKVMQAFKSYASQFLNQANLDEPDRKRWARHGSTRWLWKQENIAAAIRYVVEGQGNSMAVFEAAAVRSF